MSISQKSTETFNWEIRGHWENNVGRQLRAS